MNRIAPRVLAFLFLYGALSLYAQNSTNNGTIRNLDVDGILFPDALRAVASTYQVIIGLEALNPPTKTVTLHLKHSTLSQALDAVVTAVPNYVWRRESSGVVHVLARAATASIGDVTITSISARALTRQQALVLIETDSSVRSWLAQHSCTKEEFGVVTVGNPLPDSSKISLEASGITLREALDQTVRKANTNFWEVAQNDSDGHCTVAIQIPNNKPIRPSHDKPKNAN